MNRWLKFSGLGLSAAGIFLLGTTSVSAQFGTEDNFSIGVEGDYNIDPIEEEDVGVEPLTEEDLDAEVFEDPEPVIGAPVLEDDFDDEALYNSPFSSDEVEEDLLEIPTPPADGTRLDDEVEIIE